MGGEGLRAYETWELTPPVLPPRSRLYPLEPIGVGTADTESLTSYIARLAEAHGLRPRTLALHECGPLLDLPNFARGGSPSLFGYFMSRGTAVNGTGTEARRWVQALEALTRRNDLRFLTFLTWGDALAARKFRCQTQAWCPACYEGWRLSGQTVYEPLLWTLSVVTACPRHWIRLRHRCPAEGCGRPVWPLVSHARLGHCSRCGAWLGRPVEAELADGQALGEQELEWQRWVVEAVGELIAAAPTLRSPVGRDSVRHGVSRLITQVQGGSLRHITRELHLTREVLWRWRRGKSRPQLDSLLWLCLRLGASPLHVLTGTGGRAGAARARTWPVSVRYRSGHRPLDRPDTRRALQRVLVSDECPPPSLREVARRGVPR